MEELTLSEKLSGRNEAAAIITAAIINKLDPAKADDLIGVANNIFRQVWSNINLVNSPPPR